MRSSLPTSLLVSERFKAVSRSNTLFEETDNNFEKKKKMFVTKWKQEGGKNKQPTNQG